MLVIYVLFLDLGAGYIHFVKCASFCTSLDVCHTLIKSSKNYSDILYCIIVLLH